MIHATVAGYVAAFDSDPEDPEAYWLTLRTQRPRLNASEKRSDLPYTTVTYRWLGRRAAASHAGGYLPIGRQCVVRGSLWQATTDGSTCGPIVGSVDEIELIGDPPKKEEAPPAPDTAKKPRPKRGKSKL